MTRLAAFCALAFVAALTAAPITKLWPQTDAQTRSIWGVAKIIDGDSIEIMDKRVRIFGVDAPETRQFCELKDGTSWPCGAAATLELRRIIAGRPVACVPRDRDAYGRVVATCRVGDLDVAAELVRNGFAIAYRRYSDEYVQHEDVARTMKRGLWQGTFQPPEEWRKAQGVVR